MSSVKIYTHPSCSPCEALEKKLEKQDIDYEEVDISESKKAYKKLVDKLGFASVPAIEKDGEIVQVGV